MGRPAFYKTPDELQAAIDLFFDSCVPKYLKDDNGQLIFDKHWNPIIIERNPPTVTGLALHLGFTTRQALLNYQGKRAFVDTVTRAKLKIEHFQEACLYDPALRPQGPIFALKNFGWKDTLGVSVEETPRIVITGPEDKG